MTQTLLNREITFYNSYKNMTENEIVNVIVSGFNKLKADKNNKEKAKTIAFEILCLYPNNKEKETIRKYFELIIFPPGRTPQQI